MSNLITWISSSPESMWTSMGIPSNKAQGSPNLAITNDRFQKWEGFGGCFNELGWIALSALDEDERERVMTSLFGPQDSCKFTFCRLPIGASDYAANWYSLNEHPDDFEMQHFSIDRDKNCLIQYIKTAMKYQPDITLFASPWSPPTWMKRPAVYNYGKMIWQQEYLQAYALYLLKFVQAYRQEGVEINQVHLQNEPVADQKFPSCLWSGQEMRDFIRDYMGPLWKAENEKCEIWLGTLNTDDYNGYPNTVLSDEKAAEFISGVGLQWAGKGAIQRINMSYPQYKIIQTENECGNGTNTWKYAEYIFDLIWHYITNGASAYVYWNMILEPGGKSTWGWPQNSMITIDTQSKEVRFNPEFYVMKHFSRYIQPGAVRLGLSGRWAGNAVAFENPDGGVVIVAANPFDHPANVSFDQLSIDMPPHSINTFICGNN